MVLNHHAVAVFGFLHEVRRNDNGRALGGKVGYLPPKVTSRQRVNAAGRFVEEQDFGLMNQSRRHREPLLVAAGQISGVFIFGAAQMKFVQHLVDTRPQNFSAQAVSPAEEVQILRHSQVAVERKFLRDVADIRPRLSPCSPQVDARHAQETVSHRQKPAEHSERRSLARAVRP